MAQNIVEKSGSWYSYKGERIGQGRENARQFLRENADIRDTIDAELRVRLGLVRSPGAAAAAAPATPEVEVKSNGRGRGQAV